MEFEKAYQGLNEQQRAAVDHIDGPLLVIAGPGTGKTQLLSVRVANILKQTDVSPENILCLTFTETGASNMRKRLADFIGPEAYKVQIQTYHAFGSYILQEHRPDLTSAIDEIERFNLVREIQAKLDPTDILRPERHTKQIISALSDIKSAALSPDDLRKIINRNQIDTAKVYTLIENDIQATSGLRYNKALPIYTRILEAIATVATAPSAKDYIVGKVEPIARVYYRELAEALAAEAAAEKPSTKAMGEWRKKFFKKDKFDRFIFGDEIANKKLLSLANIMEAYADHLKQNGLFDYDDMIHYAIDLLKNDDEKRFNAQERFQYILLDEFQDTNDAQAQLVALLTDNPANEGRPNIMAVGDDDQAIYGFQGANTSNFFDFDEKYHPEHIFLTKNYRSSAPILEFSHNVIEQSDDRFCKAPNVNIDKHITAENPPASTKIELREFPAYQEEYSFIATEIRRLIDAGTPGNKIAIIAPKHKYLMSILPYLHDQDVPVSYQRRENILENEDVIQVMNTCDLLLAINVSPKAADPYWFQTLSMPCWNIGAANVITLIQDARAKHRTILEEMLASKNDDIKSAAIFLTELAAKAKIYSAEAIISNLCAKLFTDKDNYELYSNLNTLRDMISTKASHAGKKLYIEDFCQLVRSYNAAEIQILNKSPYHESDTAVQLQTVHSAKGLEYEHVFLVATDNKNWSDARGNSDQIKLPRNLEYVRHTGDSADEKIRVFFVAITRAKANLYLTYSRSNFAGQDTTRLKFLDEREDDNGNTISKVIPAPFEKVIFSEHEDIDPHYISPNRWLDQYVPTDEVRKNQLRPLVEHYRLSPTHLNTFLDLTYSDGPLSFLRNYIIRVPTETTAALNYGIYIHEIMDEICREKISDDEAIKRFMVKIDNTDASDEEKEDLKKRAKAELPPFLAKRGDRIRNDRADSERNFSRDNIVLGDAVLTGKIDRIEIDEENKTITVADYKTGAPKSKWEVGNSTFGYKIQLYFYKFLIENCADYKGYTVTHGRLDYIAADNDGDITSLELKFKPDEAEEIKHLIQVVFRHIKTLDLPDIEAARAKYNPTKALYDQLVAEEITSA